MSEGRLAFYVVGEDEAHRALAMALTDASTTRLAQAKGADWLDVEQVRRWSAWEEDAALPEGRRFSRLKDASSLRLHSLLGGKRVPPGGTDLRKAIVLALPVGLKDALHDHLGQP